MITVRNTIYPITLPLLLFVSLTSTNVLSLRSLLGTLDSVFFFLYFGLLLTACHSFLTRVIQTQVLLQPFNSIPRIFFVRPSSSLLELSLYRPKL